MQPATLLSMRHTNPICLKMSGAKHLISISFYIDIEYLDVDVHAGSSHDAVCIRLFAAGLLASGMKDEAAGVYYSLLHGLADRAHQVRESHEHNTALQHVNGFCHVTGAEACHAHSVCQSKNVMHVLLFKDAIRWKVQCCPCM